MSFFLSIFCFSLVELVAMISFRYWEIQKRQAVIAEPHKIDFAKQGLAFAELERKIWEEGRHWSIWFGTYFLRFSIIAIDKVRIEMRKLIAKMENAMNKKHGDGGQGSASFFLKDMIEHKKKIRAKTRENEEESIFVDRM